MTVSAALAQAAERLAVAGCETPQVDAELLLAHVLRTTRSGLYADSRRALQAGERRALAALVSRRERREPLAYVLGQWGFRRLTLTVDRRVLIPRPETEIVVERCLALIEAIPGPRVLDVGTGSGAIALAIAQEHPGARVTAVDVSEDALSVARENVGRTGIEIEVLHLDLFEGLPPGPWELVVSNPPYVEPEDIEQLEPEVRGWEPREALVSDGATHTVARGALEVLSVGGTLVLETADGKADRVATELRELGYEDVHVTSDLAGRERVVEGRRA